MEKWTAHVPLARVKALLREGRMVIARRAIEGAALLGMNEADIADVVTRLTPADFYKSMTTYADHRTWQDVYRPITDAGAVYLKLTVTEDVLVISFKEL